MTVGDRLSEVFSSAEVLPFDDTSKFILLSDCHRGYGDARDEFKDNRSLFLKTLSKYYDLDFTYVEVGDGDELWKNGRFERIYATYPDIFHMMQKYYREKKLYLVVGNHDNRKVDPQFLYQVLNEDSGKTVPLFPEIRTHEGLVLTYTPTGKKIFVVHGHQGDLFCDRLWTIGKIIVNTPIWDFFEYLDLDDRINPAKNHEKRKSLVKEYEQWAAATGHILICGHTHQAHFPRHGEPPY